MTPGPFPDPDIRFRTVTARPVSNEEADRLVCALCGGRWADERLTRTGPRTVPRAALRRRVYEACSRCARSWIICGHCTWVAAQPEPVIRDDLADRLAAHPDLPLLIGHYRAHTARRCRPTAASTT